MVKLNSVGFRIIAAIAAILIVVSTALLVLFVRDEFNQTVNFEVHAARNLLLMAESVRENMADKWRMGLFSPEQLRAYEGDTEQERMEKVLAAIPVVAAWESARAKADEGGFEFRSPRRNARNSDNEPDAIERQALDYFQSNPRVDEYMVIDRALDAVRYFRPVRLEQMCLYCHGDPARSQEIWGRRDGKDITGYRMENKRVGDLHGAFEIIKPLHDSRADTNAKLIALIVLITVVLFGTIGLIGWLSWRMVTVPIDSTVNSLVAAQNNGDLNFRLPKQNNDEMQRLADGFNQFITKIQSLVRGVAQSSTELDQATQEVDTVTSETHEGVRQQQSETDQVATAMNQMTATVEEVARNAAAAAEAARNADIESSKGKTVVQETMRAIEQLANDIERTSQIIARLESDAEQIGAVVDVINGVAEQTNLLALNAAIEAARAGEQGRGFSVVADEVRSLASRTQKSTGEIQQMIQRLQAAAAEAVTAMNQGQTQAHQSVAQAVEAGQGLDSITQAVATISDMNQQIATAAEEQTAVAEEINRNIVNISRVADLTSNGAERTIQATRHLSELAHYLRQQLDQFQV